MGATTLSIAIVFLLLIGNLVSAIIATSAVASMSAGTYGDGEYVQPQAIYLYNLQRVLHRIVLFIDVIFPPPTPSIRYCP